MTQATLWKSIGAGALLATIFACGGSSSTAAPQHYAFVANQATASISRFKVLASGALTNLGTPATTYANPGALVTTPDGKYLFSTSNVGAIDQFAIGTNGSLTPITATTPTALESVTGIAATNDGKYVFVTAHDNSSYPNGYKVYQFVVGSDGSLTPNATPSIAAPWATTDITMSPNGQYAYLNIGNGISCYTINSDGTLSPNGSNMPVSLVPFQVGFSLSGANLYVGCWGSNLIAQVGIQNDGTLSGMTNTSVPGPTFCQALAVSPVSGQVYSTSQQDVPGIRRYSVAEGGPYPGGLSEITPAFTSVETGVVFMKFSDQNVLYMCNATLNKVVVLTPDSSGALNQLDSENVPGSPQAIAFATR